MNKLIIIGNLTRDPEVNEANNGQVVTNFTVAVNKRGRNGHPEATYFRVAAWDQLGALCTSYLSKGRKVCVTGSVEARGYVARDGAVRAQLEVTAREVEFLTPRGDEQDGETVEPVAADALQPVQDEDCPY